MSLLEALHILDKSEEYNVKATTIYHDGSRVYKINFSFVDQSGVVSTAEALVS